MRQQGKIAAVAALLGCSLFASAPVRPERASGIATLAVELRLSIPTCTPTIVGIGGVPLSTAYPMTNPLVVSTLAPVRIVVASTCQYPRWICLDFSVECDSRCVNVFGSGFRTKPRDEIRYDSSITLQADPECWRSSESIACRVPFKPSALSDMNGDCEADLTDARLLAASQAWNRLEVFAILQREFER